MSPDGPTHIARLEFAQTLLGPEHANRIHVQLPDGRTLACRLPPAACSPAIDPAMAAAGCCLTSTTATGGSAHEHPDGHERNDPVRALKQTRTQAEAWRAAEQAEGFVLGLTSADNEQLYLVFDLALQRRLLDME